MDCGRFLRTYSEYRDGLADPTTRREVEDHLRHCPRCAQYHTAVSQGVLLLRDVPSIEPSDRFRRGLRRRLVDHGGGGPAAVTATARVAAALLVAIATTLLILEGIARSSADHFAARKQPAPVVVANPGVPFVGFAHQRATPVVLTERPDAVSRAASYAP